MIITDETKATAQAVLDYIEANPENHNQSDWVFVDDESTEYRITEENLCNTTMCVAGTTVFLREGIGSLNDHSFVFEEKAMKYLGLKVSEAHALFYNMSNTGAVEQMRAIANGDVEAFWEAYEEDNE